LLHKCGEALIENGHRVAGSTAGCCIAAATVSPQLWLFLKHLTKMRHGRRSEVSLYDFAEHSNSMAEGDITKCTLPDELALAGLPTTTSFNTIHAFVDALQQQVST